jgi:Raf kinase inhibitor-like YbhB/YbcL family protein
VEIILFLFNEMQERKGMRTISMRLAVAITFVSIILFSCAAPPQPVKPISAQATISISSQAFQDGARIPVKYTCEGLNISPPLQWANTMQGIKSYALILEDPDTSYGTLTHWIVFNISPDSNNLPEGVPIQTGNQDTFSQGNNSFGKTGYDGPCPPLGQSHRYVFSLYALDTMLSQLKAGASKSDVLEAMRGHILASERLTGIFGQSPEY